MFSYASHDELYLGAIDRLNIKAHMDNEKALGWQCANKDSTAERCLELYSLYFF